MKEDPLERLDREAREKSENKGNKTLLAILVVAVLVLAAVLAYIWVQKSALVSELESEKVELEDQMLKLQSDFSELESDNELIRSQLDTSREQVNLLIEKLKKTEATNRSKIRQYEKELGTLRTIMKGYIVQIDSLNTLNHKLTADAAAARQEAARHRAENANLSQQVQNLSSQVATGSLVKARGLKLEAYNGSDKVTDRSSRTKRLMATLSLIENDLAEKGPITIYIRVKGPDEILLMNSSSEEFLYNGSPLQATAQRTVDYEGQEVELSIYVNDIPDYTKGIYSVEAYTAKSLLGKAEMMLR